MTTASLREQLQHQLEVLPDDIIAEIADFTAFILARRRNNIPYSDWKQSEWKEFVLAQFLGESDDDVEYTLEDAKEVYHQ
ncbi:MAG: hypothetical protein U0350_20840 [Caldilineaceae bacterium]